MFVNDIFNLDQADLSWLRGSVTSNPSNPPSLRACNVSIYSSTIQIIQISILSMYVLCYHSPYITTGIYFHDLICIFLNKKAYQIKPIICMSLSVDHIPIGTVLLHRIYACILQFYHSSTPSSLDRLHMECIQAAHVLLIPLSLTHNSHIILIQCHLFALLIDSHTPHTISVMYLC